MRNLLCITALCTALVSINAVADQWSSVAINGQRLTDSQLRALEIEIGAAVEPGNYLVNFNNGCWMNLNNGASGCSTGTTDVYSRYGSGSRDAAGNWNHWSDAAGGAVGGTSGGCVYTTYGWSNC